MVKQQHQFFVSLLCIVDGAVIALATMLAWAIMREQISIYPGWGWPTRWEEYFKEPLVLFSVPVGLIAMWACGLYRPRRDRSLWGESAAVVKASFFTFCAMVVVLWAVGNSAVAPNGELPTINVMGREVDATRVQFGLLAVLLPGMLVSHRIAFRITLRHLRSRGWNLRHVAIIGVSRLGQVTCATIRRNSWTGISVQYFVSHHDRTNREKCSGLPVLGGLEELERIIDENPVDAVYVAVPNSRAAKTPQILQKLDRFAVDVRIIPDVQPRHLPQGMSVSELDGMPVLSYRESPLYGLGGFNKRMLDIIGAAFGLIVFSPVMLLCAIAVRMSGPGPVIFKQRRVSIGGERFKIYKFRTMYHVEDEQGGPRWTERNDPRVTPVGKFLRSTSLDELPQLLNVLKGQMSLVGPRPERPELIERFRDDWRGYMIRQHVKAGITGWAQVNGLRGDTSLKKRLQYDLFYIRHWSLMFDLRILWLTVFRGFVHRNAH